MRSRLPEETSQEDVLKDANSAMEVEELLAGHENAVNAKEEDDDAREDRAEFEMQRDQLKQDCLDELSYFPGHVEIQIRTFRTEGLWSPGPCLH